MLVLTSKSSSPSEKMRSFLIIVTVLPLLMGNAVRAAAWMVIMGTKGLANAVLVASGIVAEPIKILYTPTAVVIGLVSVLLPFTIITLQSVIDMGADRAAVYSFAYVPWMHAHMKTADPACVAKAYTGLVLSERELQTLGLIVDSRRSLFLTGPPGCGKTTAAMTLHDALEGEIWVPYAIEVDGHVIRVFDPHVHHPVAAPEVRYDKRWIKIQRPLVIVGGELTLESMDLIYAGNLNFYEAPFQVKANGGVLIIDDFLASGQTILGLARLAEAAGSKIVGVGALIEKIFEGGRDALKSLGVPIYSLACITAMENDKVIFGEP